MQILHSGVGQLTPNDVNLAVASGAHVVSFNLGPGNAALEKVGGADLHAAGCLCLLACFWACLIMVSAHFSR